MNPDDAEICAPGKLFEDGSCISLDVLIEMAKAFNEENPDNIIKMNNNYEILNPSNYKKYLVRAFKEKLGSKCKSQHCWTEQSFIRKMKENHKEELKNDTIASLVQKTAKGAQILIQKIDSEPPTTPPSSTKPTFSTLKEAKQWQKAQEEAKHKALLHQGINPLSLLTKENLTQWIQEERKAYSVIARELVGLPELQVASTAKEFGIKPVIGRPQKPKN